MTRALQTFAAHHLYPHTASMPSAQHVLQVHEYRLNNPDIEQRLTPEQHTIAQHSGTLTLLGQHLLQHPQLPASARTHLYELTCDLAQTYTAYDPKGPALQDQITRLHASPRPDRNRLTPTELPHAAALLLQAAQQFQIPLPPHLEDIALLPLPEHPQDPLSPSLQDLLPLPTRSTMHQAREHDLLALQRAATTPAEQYAALLLLHVNARDQQAAMPILHVLNVAALALLAAHDVHREGRTSTDTVRALQQHLKALHLGA